MFVFRFIHYLKPHRFRLAVAVVCMFVVSFFGTANILMLSPLLQVLLNQQGLVQVQAPAAAPAPEEHEAGPAAEASAEAAAEPAAPGSGLPFNFSPSQFIPAGIRERTAQLRADWKAWYTEKARNEPFTILLAMCGFLVGMTAIKGVAEVVSQFQLSYAFFFVTIKLREDIYRHVLSQDYLFFVRQSPGYLNSRINSDVGDIKSILQKFLLDGIQQPLTLLMSGAALLIVSPQLTLVTVMLLPPVGFLLYRFSKTLRENTKQQKKKADKLNHTLTEALTNARLVKAFGTEELEIQKFVARSRDLFVHMMNRKVAKFASGPIMEVVGALAISGVLLLGGWMILGNNGFLGGTLTFDRFVVYLALLTRFYRPLKSLSATTLRYQTAKVSAERVTEMLELKPKVLQQTNARPFKKLEQGIEFKDVRLKYGKKEILKGVSLVIPKGKVVALVGRTGSGKTTIANLVARLFDASEGQILIDGVDIREYNLADLRGRLGIVTQQTWLFDDTIEHNITYGAAQNGATPEEAACRLVSAAHDASAEDFIQHLEGGKAFRTKVGPGGARLSGGQSQRIAIARALYRDPQILIFDEATSALDTQTQAVVQETINRVVEHRTALVISHRLSTTRDADIIYVLEDGRVVESGKHEELMTRRGVYFSLYCTEELEEVTAHGALPPEELI